MALVKHAPCLLWGVEVKIIGLTGGIASGKSTVRQMLETRGATVLDADAIYHELIARQESGPSPLARQIEASFAGALDAHGTIDRQKLAERVYADATARAVLNGITHPAVATEFDRRARNLAARRIDRLVYDVPLLYEAGLDRLCAAVIVVWVPGELQIERMMARDGMSRAQAEARVCAQGSLDGKRQRATWVIDNSGAIASTEQQVELVWLLAERL